MRKIFLSNLDSKGFFLVLSQSIQVQSKASFSLDSGRALKLFDVSKPSPICKFLTSLAKAYLQFTIDLEIHKLLEFCFYKSLVIQRQKGGKKEIDFLE
jgi:hypothetical protein